MGGFVRASSSTKRSLLARVVVGLLAAAAIVPATSGSSQAITGTVDANAYALQGSVSLLGAVSIPIALTDAVHSSGGLSTNSPVAVNVPGAASATAVATSADGDPLADTASSSSNVAGLNIAGLITASTIATSCTTSSPGAAPTASATVTGLGSGATLAALGLSLGALPGGAAPANTQVAISLPAIPIVRPTPIQVGTLYLNTQPAVTGTATPGSLRTASVTALRLTINAVGLAVVDVTVGSSDCTTTSPTAPTINAGGLSPTQGPEVGGTTLTIDGTNFVGTNQVQIDGVSVPFTRTSATRLTLTTPAHAPGDTVVKVFNAAAPAGVAAAQVFKYLPTPTVTAINPATGPATGGTVVTITGTGFTGATAVTFDGTNATSFTPVNATTITAVAPPGSGTDFVQVTAPGGTSVTGAGNAYVYVAVPTLTSISPTSGPTSGGTTVTLTGTGFTAAAQVKVDGVALAPAAVTYVNSTTLRIPTPAHAAGSVPITVTTNGGTTAARTFDYLPLPTVSSLTPSSGTVLGTNTLVIAGTNLTSVTGVTIDGTNAPITLQPAGGLSLSVTVPAHLATGPVNVVLTGPGSVTTNAGTYVYTLTLPPPPTAPTVTSLTPNNGPQVGGTSVQITGTNFTGTTSVKFGTLEATSFVVNSSTSLTAVAPAAASFGSVSVTVTNGTGVSAITGLLDTYLYNPFAPGITSLSPDHGPTAGGTTVTLNGSAFTPISTVTLDGTALSATYVDGTHMTVTMPPHAAGNVSLAVQTLGLASNNQTYTYQPPVTVSGLTPTSGSTVGGTTVTVTGTNLDYVDGVTVGGTNVSVDPGSTPTSLVFTTPSHAAGSVAVLLTNGDGLSLNAGSFLYVQPAPVASSVAPDHGPLAGGNSVTVTGSNLTGVTGVTIGGVAATNVNVVDSTHVSATVPASSTVGATTLALTGPGGTSGTLAYTYDPLPVLSTLSPTRGAATGNTAVAITGSGFTNSTGVRFGATLGTGFTVVDDSHLTVLTPAHAAGIVDVTVTGPSGTSDVTAAGRFTFIDTTTTPVISGISPNLDTDAGGASVTVSGSGFFTASSVTFGGTAGTALTVVDDSTLTVTAPAHVAGTFDVIVTKPGPISSSGAGTANDFTYVTPGSAPVVSGVSPARGPLAGGTLVYLSGVGFTGTTAVTVGGVAASGFTVISDTQISLTTPPNSAGAAHVTVTNGSGSSSTNTNDLFTYVTAATVSGLSPTQGPAAGGTSVTVTGTNFTGATGVNFGTDAGTNVVVNSDTSITVTSPPHASGQVDVTVAGVGGTSAVVNADHFTYLPAPAVTGLSPTSGPIAGGTTVTITGTNFNGTTAVSFGGTNGTGLSVSSTSITVTSPAHPAGPVDVVVTNPGGTSPVVAGDRFTFVPAAPSVGAITPAAGPVAGGTTVTLTGTGFSGATAVNFGATPGTNVLIGSDTSLTVSSPPHSSGPVDVTVVGPGGTSAVVPADQFTFNPLPTLGSLSPSTGPIDGGTTVTLTGTGFSGATAVQFGGVNGTNITGVTGTSITVDTPAHALGAVDVIVLGPNGASAAGPQFTYTQPVPVIGSLSPTSGPEGGGTTVTINGSGFSGATDVRFGTDSGTDVVISSDTSLSVTSPLHAPGTVAVTVISPGGTSNGSNFTFNPGPAITAPLSPAGDSTAGGTSVVITGTNFTGATSVDFGGVNGTGLVVSNGGTTITVTSPPHAAALVNVRVVTPDGVSPIVPDDQFTYAAPTPDVTGVSPNTGSIAGGTTVTVTGSGFTGATDVGFGALPGSNVLVNSDTSLTVTSPVAALAGTVDVTVTGPGGTSATSAADEFIYTALLAPTVTSVSPATGTDLGNTTVTVTGTNFVPLITTVSFGGTTVAATDVTVNSGTSLTVASPAHAAGLVYVQVTNGVGTSTATTAANEYTYASVAPTVTGVSPSSGSTAGGTLLTVSGSGYSAGTTVTVDGTTVTPTVVNGSTLTVLTPAHPAAGTVNVTVTDTNGSDSGQFTYVTPAPTVTSLNLTSGTTHGAVPITITGTNFTGATAVDFGGSAGTALTVNSPTSITVTTPAHAAGTVHVRVTTPGGQSAVNAGDQYTFVQPAPAVTGISPGTGSTGGGDTVVISGDDFVGVTAVSFGSFAASSYTVDSRTQITVTSPAGTGIQNVRVTTNIGTSPITAADEFTYVVRPTVSGASPDSGPVGGGTLVTITGSGFTGLSAASAVQFGGTNATSYTVVNGSTITAVAPSGAAGTVHITVASAGGTSSTSSNDRYTYVAAPDVTGVSPATGSIFGGDVVTLTGTGFTGATTVFFGSVAVTPTTVSGTTIIVTAPPGSAGPVDVTVTTPYGTSSGAGSADDYTYTLPGAPTVGTISPSAGPTAGGIGVTLTGTGFTGATAVTFGGVNATAFTVVNDTTITATVPAHAAGNVVVSVTTPGGTSSGGPSFSFSDPGSAPVVGGISPNRGPAAGGNRVTISGAGFTGATRVLFGNAAGTGLVVVNDTTITVLVPAGSSAGGTVDVTVTGPNGISLPRAGATYTYVPLSELPTVSAVTPDVGPVAGGTTVTITGTHFDATTTVSFGGVLGTGVTLGPDVGAALRRPGVVVSGSGFRAAYANQLTVVTPAHTAGPTTLVLTNVAGSAAFDKAFTFIPLLKASTVKATVKIGSKTPFAVGGPGYVGLLATACSEPAGPGSTQLAADQLSCTYTAAKAGTQTFTMTLVDVLGQTATRTVTVTVTEDGGTGTGGGGGNDTDGGDNGGTGGGSGGGNDTDGGGTGTGGGGGNATDGGSGSGSGSGSGGLAFTGAPYLLVPGLVGGLVLLLVGAGLLTGDRFRNRPARSGPASGSGISLVTGVRRERDDDRPDDAA